MADWRSSDFALPTSTIGRESDGRDTIFRLCATSFYHGKRKRRKRYLLLSRIEKQTVERRSAIFMLPPSIMRRERDGRVAIVLLHTTSIYPGKRKRSRDAIIGLWATSFYHEKRNRELEGVWPPSLLLLLSWVEKERVERRSVVFALPPSIMRREI